MYYRSENQIERSSHNKHLIRIKTDELESFTSYEYLHAMFHYFKNTNFNRISLIKDYDKYDEFDD